MVSAYKKLCKNIDEGIVIFKQLFEVYPDGDFSFNVLGGGIVYISTMSVRDKKSEIENKTGIVLTPKYDGDGDLSFVRETGGVHIKFMWAVKCEQVGVKKMKKIVTKEITPAVTERVEEDVEVPVFKCAEGKEFVG